MGTKKIFLSLVTFFMLFLVLGQLSHITASLEPFSWKGDTLYYFTSETETSSLSRDLEDGFDVAVDYTSINEWVFNITEIDELTGQITYQLSREDFVNSYHEAFTMSDFLASRLTLSNLFYVDYTWDFDQNKTIIHDFLFLLNPYYFIEPSWSRLNQHFREVVLNSSAIIDTVADPYHPLIHNITLEDFLNDLNSFRINKKTNLADAKKQFTEKTMEWSFEFDFSGSLYFSEYDADLGRSVYKPMDNALFTFSFRYSKGGILERLTNSFSLHYVKDNIDYSESESALFILGTIDNLTAGFSYLLVVPALTVVVILTAALKRHRKAEHNVKELNTK